MGSLLYFSGADDKSQIDEAISRTLLGKKQSSIDADKNAISHFLLWNGYRIPDKDAPLRYIEHARTKLNHSNKTIRGALVRLRRIFEPWGLYKDFSLAMRLVRVSATPERRTIKLIDPGKIRDLLNAFDLMSPVGKRDQCMIALMLGGGLRISEVLGLTVGAVKTTWSGTVYVSMTDTKKGVPDNQAIAPDMARILLDFRGTRITAGAGENSPLITTYSPKGRQGRPTEKTWDRRNATEAFYRACDRIGIKASPHSCRATAITMLLAQGIPHREVQEFSRHSNVAMVEIYDKREFGVDQCAGQKLKF